MTGSSNSSPTDSFLKNALEATIRIGVVVLLAAWCFQIIKPFVIPTVWGIIIAVALNPLYGRLRIAMGDRRRLAALVVTLLALTLLIVPAAMLMDTLLQGAHRISDQMREGNLHLPLPPERVGTWPLIGKPLAKFWHLASVNIREALAQIAPQLKAFSRWLLSAAAGAGFGLLQFVFAIVIAGIFLAHSKSGHHAAHSIAARLAGERGPALADLAEATVRSVARGILGVAIIQSLLAGLGFLAVGIPGAGLWALLCLILGVIQIGPFLVLLPIVIYVFSTSATLTAVVFLIWCVFVALIDNVLKPLLLGRGVDVPMVVIFIGAIGGFLSMGIIGLFVGSIIVVLGYTIFVAWLNEDLQHFKENSGHTPDS